MAFRQDVKLPVMAWASLVFSVELLPKLLGCFLPALCLNVTPRAEQGVLVARLSPPNPSCWSCPGAGTTPMLLTDCFWQAASDLPQAQSDGCPFAQDVVGARKGPHWKCPAPAMRCWALQALLVWERSPSSCAWESLDLLGRWRDWNYSVGHELASFSLTGKRERKISVPEKRMKLSGKCMCFIRWCLTTFKFFFDSQWFEHDLL